MIDTGGLRHPRHVRLRDDKMPSECDWYRILEMYKVSSYEKKVIEILNKEKVKFVKEKTFSDLHHGYYRFDFFLPEENVLLEVQGRQHTEFTKVFYKSRSDFLKAQERDREKISYCLSHKIPLYCIPWWDMDKISSVKDLLMMLILRELVIIMIMLIENI